VEARTLYEAVGLAIRCEHVQYEPKGLHEFTVEPREPGTEHRLASGVATRKMFDTWLRRPAGSPADMALKSRLKEILGDVARGSLGIVCGVIMGFTKGDLLPKQASDLRINPSDEVIGLGGLAVRFLLTGDDSNASIAAFELTVAGLQRLPGPAHSHDHYEETIYGIEGVMTWSVDGKQIEVGPGQALCIPRGAVHRFDNHGKADAKALCMITPAAIGPLYFREVSEVFKTAGDGPPDRAKMGEIMRRHGLTPALPPVGTSGDNPAAARL
jgi:quercetin dioxygenase-like cupin family protein